MVPEHAKLVGIWANIMRRCYDPDYPQFSYYGGRGIDVCERWHDFGLFAQDVSPRPDGLSLDRIDNDRGYSPGNCRWADAHQQAQNRRSCVKLTVDGVTKTAAEWARIAGFNAATVIWRRRQGWPDKEAVFGPSKTWHKRKPPGRAGRLVAINGELLPISAWEKRLGMSRYRIEKALKSGKLHAEAPAQATTINSKDS
jgi:hypothetical protein